MNRLDIAVALGDYSKILGIVLYDGPSLLDGVTRVICVANRLNGSKNAKSPQPQTWIFPAEQVPRSATKTGTDAAVCGTCPRRPTNAARLVHQWDLSGRVGPRPPACYVRIDNAPRVVHDAWRRGQYVTARARHLGRLGAGRSWRWGAWGDPAAIPAAIIDAVSSGVTGTLTGYTHAWREGFALQRWLMASADSLADVALAESLGYRAFFAAPPGTPRPPRTGTCPAAMESGKLSDCERCGACDGTRRGLRGHRMIWNHDAGNAAATKRILRLPVLQS